MAIVTYVLVIGIRESAIANAILTCIKLGVVLFVIAVGFQYVNSDNWTKISMVERRTPVESFVIPGVVKDVVNEHQKKDGIELSQEDQEARVGGMITMASAAYRLEHIPVEVERLKGLGKFDEAEAARLIEQNKKKYEPLLPRDAKDKELIQQTLEVVRTKAHETLTDKWGILGYVGLNDTLTKIDDSVRSNFMPFGISGLMLGASIVFFAFIGFDSISTHSEEAIKPQRDVPIGIIASLVMCTALYLLVSAVITGMVPYPEIDPKTAVASAFSDRAHLDNNPMLRWSSALISTGALAGMTSVLLITFLSQARVFLAMARDRLLPPSIFGAVHPKYGTPHISTIGTGVVICLVAAFTPIHKLEEMVNIGTLFAFVVVCAAVLILRVRQPNTHRPFRTPFLFVVAPLGIAVNLLMMLFLPVDTWIRLFAWLGIGLVIYFAYGIRHSSMSANLQHQLRSQGLSPTDAPLDS
jgi:APA family basic amino acid/polyamine antiporter